MKSTQSALIPGSTIGVIALSSPSEPKRFELGLKYLRSKGFNTKVVLNPTRAYGKSTHLFSSDSARSRARALESLFADPKVGAIIAARGGYGAMEVLPLIDFSLLRRFPKPFVGYSDSTAFLLSLYGAGVGFPIHGPSIEGGFSRASTNRHDALSVSKLLSYLCDRSSNPLKQVAVKQLCGPPRQIRAPLIGGNLTLIASLLGTPWEPEFKRHILFLEDRGEKPHRIHRMLLQLKLARKFEGIKAVLLGGFTDCGDAEHPKPSLRDVFEDIFEDLRIPVAWGAPFGHQSLNFPLPLGCRALLTSKSLDLV
ncbi:MAG: LD-carboxypeptidase [Oligoflexia bacterium]|nr:LD-carboxypeptidase [Oligoflexia bacterium]